MKIAFEGKIVIIGSGAVSKCLQYLLVHHVEMDFSKVTIIDVGDEEFVELSMREAGARFVRMRIMRDNYVSVLQRNLAAGDLLIDLAVELDTADLIDWCQQHGVLFLNTVLDWWHDEEVGKSVYHQTFYSHHMYLLSRAKQWNTNGPTAIVEHGTNPGLVSHWTKRALERVAERIITITHDKERRNALEQALDNQQFPELAQLTGTRIVQVTERDSQITRIPKRLHECVNTWSITSFYDESVHVAEVAWGTHEQKIPTGAHVPTEGAQHELYLDTLGMNFFMYSWTPSDPFIGMLIRHEEVFTLGNYLTLKENNRVVYRPSIYFVYLPCDSAFASLHEVRMNKYQLPQHRRIITDDIVDGHDEVGVLLLGHDLHGWWEGSLLSIHETRELVGGHNATILQVAAGMLGALFWMIEHPQEGLCFPEDLPHKDVLAIANRYLGTCVSQEVSWRPFDSWADPIKKRTIPSIKTADDWCQFEHFVVQL